MHQPKGKPAMLRSVSRYWISLSRPIKRSIIVTMLGVIALITIMQSTAYTVRKHAEIASLSIFPAALKSQQAGTAFEKMNRDYSDAVVLQEKAALAGADQEAATVTSSLDSAAAFMAFNPGRHQQIISLLHRFTGLHLRAKIDYAAVTESNGIPPTRADLENLAHENKAVEAALEALRSDLAGDFRAKLAVVNELLVIQEIFETVVLVGLTVALFFSVRSMIGVTVQRREDEILRQAHLVQDNERTVLRALIDNIPDFVYVKDLKSRFLVANSHLARIVGADTPDDLLGKTDFDFFPSEIAKAFFEDEQNVMGSGQPLFNREEKSIDSAGNDVYVLTTKVPVRDNKGQVTGIACIGHDISKRKMMENELRETEFKYRGIFDKAIVGIFQSTPEGHFLSVNPSMASTFSYDSPEEMIATIVDISSQFFVSPKRGVEFMLVMDKVGGVKNFECEAFCKDGSKIWVTMSIRAIRKNGVVIRYEGMCEDITERNLLREQLFQAQKLESVGQLAAGIAHEINTPTQYIGDNVRFLKEAFQDFKILLTNYERLLSAAKDNTLSHETMREIGEAVEQVDASYLLEEIPKAIDQTLEGVTRVSTLVSAMKEFSHPGTKEKVSLDLNHAIDCTITVARNEWRYVADLETDFDSSLPPVPCQPGEFNQVILNLIVNAAHAIADVVKKGGPAKGTINVRTRNCPEWVEIRIQDTGTGVPESLRSRIFDPFFTTKEIGKGTGQGLSIARSVIVDKHNGTIHFETEEGKGTTFVIRLPHEGNTLSNKGRAA
jgi:PAS domain S-box-containing protein